MTMNPDEYISEAAKLFNAVPLEELPGNQQEATFLAGCLMVASVTTIDELFADVAEMRDDRWMPSPESVQQLRIISDLPARFAQNYGAVFAQRFTIAFADMTKRLTEGWTPLACVAQELAFRILLEEVEVLYDMTEVAPPAGWRDYLEDALLEDADHEYLYDYGADGFEDDPDFGPPGMANMRFDAWFRPFNSERHLPPILELAHQG